MRLYATLLRARLIGNLLPNATSLTVDDASSLPTLGAGEYFTIQIVEGPVIETVHATALSTNTFTVIRAQEGSSKKRFYNNALCLITIDPYGFELPSSGGGGAVDSVNGHTGVVVLNTDDLSDSGHTNKFVTAAEKTKLSNLSGINSGDQTSIVGIIGTKAEFDAAVSDGNILYVGDITQYTDEMAQDATGAMVGTSIVYNDASATLQRAALTGDVTASQDSNSTTIANDTVTYAKMQNVSATDKILGRFSASAGDVEEIACTAAGRNLIDDVDASAQRTTLGLGTLATQSGTFSGTSSGTNTGDQTITLTGDVTGSGTGSFAATIATPGSVTVATNDKVLIKDTSASDVTKYVTAQSIADLHTDAVTSVNAKTGVVVLDSDDISDTGKTHKFTTASDISKLAGIAANADVTLTAIAALSNPVTIATNDKVVIKDTSASDAAATVTTQAIRDLAPTAGTTGTGLEVRQTSPTLITPILGVAAATSINFGGSTLANYDENGTFTPSITFATPGTFSVTYSARTGFYTRIGNLVYMIWTAVFTPTLGTASGQVRLGGLPLTGQVINHGFLPVQKSANVTFNGTDSMFFGYYASGSTYFTVRSYGTASAQSDLTTANFTTGAAHTLVFCGCYLL